MIVLNLIAGLMQIDYKISLLRGYTQTTSTPYMVQNYYGAHVTNFDTSINRRHTVTIDGTHEQPWHSA